MERLKTMKVALVHDYLVENNGGAERVLEVLASMWPEAPIFVLLYDPDKASPVWKTKDIRTSFLEKIPFFNRHYKWLLALMPLATELHDLSGYDVVISSTSAFAKAIITHADTVHLSYIHTPTRYLWSDSQSYLKAQHLPPILNELTAWELSRLRRFDFDAAARVDQLIANSKTVQKRITKYYRRDSTVIYPPINIDLFAISPSIGDYFLAGGRIVAYKKFDLIVEAFNQLGYPLVIFGDGPELNNLKDKAKNNITFVGRISEIEKARFYQKCLAYINPQEEDFGITVIEAMASGRPVIAYNKGGATETVIDGVTGILFDEQTPAALISAIKQFRAYNFVPQTIRDQSLKFDAQIFIKNIRDCVVASLAAHHQLAPKETVLEKTSHS